MTLTSKASYNSEILNSLSDKLQIPHQGIQDPPQSGPKLPFHGESAQT